MTLKLETRIPYVPNMATVNLESAIFFSGLKSFAASRRPYGKPVTIKLRIKRRLPKYEN